MKEKEIYSQSYKKPYIETPKGILQELTDQCIEARTMKMGIVKRGDKGLHFQDIRIYLKDNT